MLFTNFGLLPSVARVMPFVAAVVEFGERIVGEASVHRAQRVRTPWFPMGLKTLCS